MKRYSLPGTSQHQKTENKRFKSISKPPPVPKVSSQTTPSTILQRIQVKHVEDVNEGSQGKDKYVK